MAALKNNGTVVFTATRLSTGAIYRVMSNGAVLKRRPGGGYKKTKLAGPFKLNRTFDQFADYLARGTFTVKIEAREWLDLEPAPPKRIMRDAPATAYQQRWVDRQSSGLLRAQVAQAKAKGDSR